MTKKRFLIFHGESDSLFEVFGDEAKASIFMSEPHVDDVTGQKFFEDLYLEEKLNEGNQNESTKA